MTSTKQAFGRFVTTKRQAAGLTQRELAERLFVTESAVSKWERGLSYPDITLVAALSRELGVSEGELINASDNAATRQIAQDALGYRRWKAAIFWTTALSYATALLTCLIVNVAVSHTLSWFWIVAAAVAAAFSLTTLPLLRIRAKGWSALGGFVGSILLLLVIIWAESGGGTWLPVPITAILFSAVVIFGPLWLAGLSIPEPAGHHRTVIALGFDTVALSVLLLVASLAAGDPGDWATRALPIAAIALVIPWAAALVLRYLRIACLFRAAIVTAFVGVYSCVVLQPAIGLVTGETRAQPIDFSQWHGDYISGNVNALILIASLLVAAVLALAAAHGRSAREARGSLDAG
jgi:transcriptional regulator with XRE-family HTH domain